MAAGEGPGRVLGSCASLFSPSLLAVTVFSSCASVEESFDASFQAVHDLQELRVHDNVIDNIIDIRSLPLGR